jgi:hypothetical protein
MSEGRRHESSQVIWWACQQRPRPHQEIIGALHVALCTRGERAGASRVMFSPIDVCLSDTDVLQPDLLFVGAERLAIIEAPWPLSVRPLSAVRRPARAISVPGLSVIGVGCPEYWIVDPDARAVEGAGPRARRPAARKGGDPIPLPGFRLPAAARFTGLTA